jgi:hypothetical protein
MSKINMLNKKFGRILVIKDLYKTKNESAIWLCKCDCGTLVEIQGRSLRSGYTRSCGCLQREVTRQMGLNHKKHGDKSMRNPARLYIIWTSIKDRCFNPKEPAFKYYGGRGISMCSEWKNNYQAFKFWAILNGYQENLTIDRINSNGDYEPKNCQWLTKSENTKKRWSDNKMLYRTYTEGKLLVEGRKEDER